MATRIIGYLELLTAEEKNLRQWFERYELFSRANRLLTDVPALAEDRSNAEAVNTATQANTAVFLSYLNGSMYSLLKSLANPDEIDKLAYSTLKTLIVNHLQPKPARHFQRYRFSTCKQENQESLIMLLS